MGGMKSSGLGRRHGREGLLKYTESQNITSQHLVPIAPFGGMSDETYARVLTGALRAMKAIGLPVTATGASTSSTPEVDVDVDVVVVGSGFGGSVTALRLAEKGYRVLVLEAGRRFEDEDFAETSWDARNYLWAPQLGCYGIQRIHRLPDVVVLAGAGVGGGSLNYANTLYVPPTAFFRDEQWADITDWESELAPHYDTASRMLGVVTNPCHGIVEELMQRTADDLGVGESFRKTPVGVFFGKPGETVDDPYFGGVGPRRTGCTECGNCMVGCRVGAKNTLRKNYLALAENLGVRDRADAHGDPAGRRARHGGRARGLPRAARAHRAGGRARRAGRHGTPRGAGRRRLGHPDAAARHGGEGRAAAAVGVPRPPHPHQLRGAARRDDAARARPATWT